MEGERRPERIVALFATLAEVEAALHALQGAGVPYPDLHMGAHTPADLDRMTIAERAALAGIALPERFWSLAVVLDPKWRDKALETLHGQHPFALATLQELGLPVDEVERGAIAWRHYVFETPAATDAVGEHAGETGMTGIISSGVFTTGALAEDKPPSQADSRSASADRSPTSDTKRPETSTDQSRPQTELKS